MRSLAFDPVSENTVNTQRTAQKWCQSEGQNGVTAVTPGLKETYMGVGQLGITCLLQSVGASIRQEQRASLDSTGVKMFSINRVVWVVFSFLFSTAG